jgi:hypothetical protein
VLTLMAETPLQALDRAMEWAKDRPAVSAEHMLKQAENIYRFLIGDTEDDD